jgi:exodeoxyribonuclease X
MTIIALLDTETTGTNPQLDQLVEFAAIKLDTTNLSPLDIDSALGKSISFTLKPEVPISAEASAVHHLTHHHLTHSFSQTEGHAAIANYLAGVDILAAHNAAFDKQFLPPQFANTPWLCTYRCARHLVPDAPRYGNQVLRYHLGLDPQIPMHLAPHRALYDVHVTAALLIHLLGLVGNEPQALVTLTNTPILLSKMTFGVHYNKPFTEIPTSYLQWLTTLTDKDPDFMHTVRWHLAQRS